MNSIKDRSVRLCLLSALALTACGDDTATPDTNDETSGGGSSSTTDTPDSGPSTSTTTTGGTTTDDGSTTMTVEPTSSSSGDSADASTTMVDPTDGSTTMVDPTEDSSSGDESSSSEGGKMPMDCPYGDLMAPDLVNADTTGQDSEFTNSCGGGGAPDVSYTLTAPADGTYFFTATSPDGEVDPLVAVYDGTCGGPELACNEDIDGTTTAARVSTTLSMGQTVTVVVDGFSVVGGAVDLEVAFFEGTCPDGDLGNLAPVLQTGSTVDGDNTTFGSCGGTTGNDDQWTFTAPEAGIYTVDTLGSNFDTVLYALDGCGGTELICNDDAGDMTSRINVTLTAGQEVVFVVDGAGLESGDYNLNVELDACPDFEIMGALPVVETGSTAGEVNSSTGSCGGGGAPDVAYTFTAPQAGTYIFDTDGSAYDTVLYALDGETCEGATLACDDDDPDFGLQSRIAVDLEADQVITVVVDGFSANAGDYTLNVTSPDCGNGTIEFGEACDTDDLDGESCASQGFSGGTLACDPLTCQLDASACDTCGNGTVEGADECDGVALGATRCEDLGFDGGALDCAGDCAFDTAQCANGIVAVCSSPAAAIDSAFPTTTDTITVPDMGTIADIDVFVDITHTFGGDLEMTLLADDLALSNELAFDQCSFNNDVFAVFNDEGSAAVGADCAEPIGIEGNLTPQQPLSVYDGGEASGSWTLSITDDAGGDTGTLNEWCVYITLE
ncbi:MAG: proprotein convertase P-domain-containing protein [Nannocystaceae bacterium]|nr:hypothetical protein [bacterium]